MTFASEGAPWDRGPDLTEAANALVIRAKEHFDTSQMFTPRSLLSKSWVWEAYFRDYTELIKRDPRYSTKLKWKESWARLGLFAWKPKLLEIVLMDSSVAPGEIVFYHDSDTIKYPEYLKNVEAWPAWLTKNLQRREVLFFTDNRARLTSDTKSEVWAQFFTEEQVRDMKHIWAGAFAVKKTPYSINLVQEWSRLCEEPENLLPFTRDNENPNFVHHSPDQGILACMWNREEKSAHKRKISLIKLDNGREIPPQDSRKSVVGTLQRLSLVVRQIAGRPSRTLRKLLIRGMG